MTATLVKQWCRNYLQEVNRHPAAYRRSRVRTFLFQGLQTFRMAVLVDTVPTLLHVSVFFFFLGLSDFLLPINRSLAYLILGILAAGTIVYWTTIIMPSLVLQCPYQTPSSHIFWHSVRLGRLLVPRTIMWGIRCLQGLAMFCGGIRIKRLDRIRISIALSYLRITRKGNLTNAREAYAMLDSESRTKGDDWALRWTLTQLDEDHELVPFIQGLPGFMKSDKVRDGQERLRTLLAHGLEARLLGILQACNENISLETSKQTQAIACLDTIWLSAPYLLFAPNLITLLVNLTQSALLVSIRARCTLTVVVHLMLGNLMTSKSFDSLSYSLMRALRIGLLDLPIIRPLQPLIESHWWMGAAERITTLTAISHHLIELRVVLLIQAASTHLQHPFDPFCRRALIEILTHPSTIAIWQESQYQGVWSMWSMSPYITKLKEVLSYNDPPPHSHPHHDISDILNSITGSLSISTWRAMAQNILADRDPNEGVTLLSSPSNLRPMSAPSQAAANNTSDNAATAASNEISPSAEAG
jgi:hypothetical protein